jgi:phosphoribosylamine--glycine ligase
LKVLVVGSGGREHALVWKLSQSPRVDKVFCAPGNAGISEIAECLDIGADDVDTLIDFAKYEWIDLTIVGPEASLIAGVVDAFMKEGRRIFGTDSKGARLGESRVFAKELMRRYGIPTAEYKSFTSYLHAEEYVRFKGAPIVIKANGLVGGRGVIVADSVDRAIDALRQIMKKKVFGSAGERVVVEQFLKGKGVSLMVLTDGRTTLPLATSQNYMAVFENDTGPYTEGMGACSPAPLIPRRVVNDIMQSIIYPLIKGLKKEGINYRGVIYANLMICDGKPYVLEFNCTFGDPEVQSILMRLKSDLFEVLRATTEGRLREMKISWKNDASVCVVLTSRGYPLDYEKDKLIRGLESIRGRDDLMIFHEATGLNDGEFITTGGRVLGVTALGKDIKSARANAYKAIKNIQFEGIYYRRDIAAKA